jgi:hypothetical protein
MNRLARTVTLASTLSFVLLLSNCSSYDPSDLMDMLTPAKKPLPGDRKPLFPSGTPGVSQGLPPELVKGYQPRPPTEVAQDAQAAPDQPKPKPKPKPKVAAAPPANPARSSSTATPAPAPASTGASASQSSPWPDPPPTRQSAAPSAGQTVWPDPPAPGTVTR